MSLMTEFSLKDGVSSVLDKIIGNMNKLTNSVMMSTNKTEGAFSKIVSSADKMNINFEKFNKSGHKTTKGIGIINSNLLKLQNQLIESNKNLEKFINTANRDIKNTKININVNDRGFYSFIHRAKESLLDLGKYAFSAFIAFQSIKRVTSYFDTLQGIDARLRLITTTDFEKEDMKKKLYNTANNLGVNTNDFSATVIKMKQLSGNTFNSNDEAIRFNELMAKSFRISGTSSQEASSALYQLTQAMASNRLQGDEFRTIIENAPMLAQAIAKKMQVPFGALKELGRKGKITADIIKGSMFDIADSIDDRFARLPRTWGQLFNTLFNTVQQAFMPLLNTINRISNSKTLLRLIDTISPIIKIIGVLGSMIFNVIGIALTYFANTILKTIEVLRPFHFLILTIIGSLFVYKNMITLITFIKTTYIAITTALNFVYGILTMTTWSLTSATSALSAAFWASPIGFVVGLVLILIGVVQTIIYLYNKWAGTSHTLSGIILGTLGYALSFVINILIELVNTVIRVINTITYATSTVAEAIYNMFVSPFDAIKNYILDTVNFVLDKFKWVAKIADSLVGSNMASKISKWQDSVSSKKTYVDGMIRLNKGQLKEFDLINGVDMFKKGKNVGDNFQNNLFKNMFPKDASINKLSDMNNILHNIADDTKSIDGETKKNNKDFVEDLKLLRDMAHKEYVAKITSPQVHINVSNNNHINTEEDKQDFISTLTEQFIRAVQGGVTQEVISNVR